MSAEEPGLRHRLHGNNNDQAEFTRSSSTSSSGPSINNGDMTRPSYGKTPTGKVFQVPTTRDMVNTLFDPRQGKSVFDMVTLGVMAVEILFFFSLSRQTKRIFFVFVFFFWRLAYNVGLGILLKYQSNTRGLVLFAKKHKIFEENAHPKLYQWLKHQLSIKMGNDYDFTTAPLEYNTWLLFRQLVDLILMNDFVSYLCFALSWFNTSSQSTMFLGDAMRWCGGLFLIVFNIWVKIDAQRVVKDYAWYWGDFFFLIEQSLTFDGVFEMAPHPMYSVGYIGYYGVSLLSASYTVLFVSIAAHAMQFAFLAWVETPHIEKTYNPPVTPKRTPSHTLSTIVSYEDLDQVNQTLDQNASRDFYSYYFRRDLIVFKNFDLFRSTDLASGALMVYALVTPIIVRGTKGIWFAVAQAVFWRIFHSYGLGTLLHAQSTNKYFTRHFVKWGGGVQQAFQNWKSIYNLSLSMTYITFFAACCKMYSLPVDWTYGTTLLQHTLGLAFIALHVWTAMSIYEVLGDYGWFYGDFFLEDHHQSLLYHGIYRYLNNPEKIVGHAAFWGMTLIASSWTIFALALFSQISNFWFLNYVEAPHMRKLYGDQIRKEAGFTKTLKSAAALALPRAFPDKLQQEVSKLVHDTGELRSAVDATKNAERAFKELLEKVERTAEETAGAVGGMLTDAAIPKLHDIVQEAMHLLESSRTRLIHPLIHHDTDMNALNGYSVTLLPATHAHDTNDANKFYLGQSIRVHWKAPSTHSTHDWIGIYKITDNRHTHISNVSSQGRWQWIMEPHEEGDIGNEGTLVFQGMKLPWHTGTYELRYHHNGKHTVMARSAPFDIVVPPAPCLNDKDMVERSLLRLIQNVLAHDPQQMPVTPLDEAIGMTEAEAENIAYAIKLMFGIEFAREIVLADKSVARLYKRLYHAHQALAPFSTVTDSKVPALLDPLSPETSPQPSPIKPKASTMSKVESDPVFVKDSYTSSRNE